MVMYFPEHINLQKCDDGHTPLHSAVMANKLDVAHFLLVQVHLCYSYILGSNLHTMRCLVCFALICIGVLNYTSYIVSQASHIFPMRYFVRTCSLTENTSGSRD